jgi:hypothetical protein
VDAKRPEKWSSCIGLRLWGGRTGPVSDCILMGPAYSVFAIQEANPGAGFEDVLLEGNIVENGRFAMGVENRPLKNGRCLKNVVYEGNVIWEGADGEGCEMRGNVFSRLDIRGPRGKLVLQDNLDLDAAPRPREPRVILRPNKYDPVARTWRFSTSRERPRCWWMRRASSRMAKNSACKTRRTSSAVPSARASAGAERSPSSCPANSPRTCCSRTPPI